MVKIKICGLTRKEDIMNVNKLGPDYVGFVFAPSKRQVSLERAKELISLLNPDIKTVGVFVDEGIEKLIHCAKVLGLDVLQLHGKEDLNYLCKLHAYSIWKAVGMGAGQFNLIKYNNFPVEALLLDTALKGKLGGSGKSFDWDSACSLNINKPIIVAGGLDPENVDVCIRKTMPYAVDVSSGVETNFIKDFNKMKEFIKKVRDTK